MSCFLDYIRLTFHKPHMKCRFDTLENQKHWIIIAVHDEIKLWWWIQRLPREFKLCQVASSGVVLVRYICGGFTGTNGYWMFVYRGISWPCVLPISFGLKMSIKWWFSDNKRLPGTPMSFQSICTSFSSKISSKWSGNNGKTFIIWISPFFFTFSPSAFEIMKIGCAV